jgi:DNA-binding transcriptional LysR family regulator
MTLESDIAVFVRLADLGTFAAVAAELGITGSGASRIVTRLERRLGAKLLQRSTRRLILTQEGERFLQYARPILMAIEEAHAAVASSAGKPSGIVRVNSGTAFAKHRLVPLIPAFLKAFPDIRIELTVSDRRIDPIAEQIDITVRVGPLADSELVAVNVGEVRRTLVASPKYLRANGRPRQPSDLLKHNCLLLAGHPRLAEWPMLENGRMVTVPVKGNVRCDSAEVQLDLAIAGAGIARVGDFLGEPAIADGRLVPLLDECHFSDPQPITALVLPARRNLPRVRAVFDGLVQDIQGARRRASAVPRIA